MPYSRLLHKLDFYGVRDQTSNWIRSFLEIRKQEVVLDGSHSDRSDVLSGVPQGTVLGPLLFLAYINDMPESLRSSDCRLFADDSLLYCVVNKVSDCKLLQQDLTALEQWEGTWQMSFNPSKCTVIRVSTGRRHKFQSIYTLHGQTLDVVDGSKYLGVTVTNNLSWSKHVSDTAGKAHRSLGFLRRNFKGIYLSKALTCMKILYKQELLFCQGDGYFWPHCCMNNLYISHRSLYAPTYSF